MYSLFSSGSSALMHTTNSIYGYVRQKVLAIFVSHSPKIPLLEVSQSQVKSWTLRMHIMTPGSIQASMWRQAIELSQFFACRSRTKTETLLLFCNVSTSLDLGALEANLSPPLCHLIDAIGSRLRCRSCESWRRLEIMEKLKEVASTLWKIVSWMRFPCLCATHYWSK